MNRYILEEYLCEERSGAPTAFATESCNDSLTAHAEFGNASNLRNLFVFIESASSTAGLSKPWLASPEGLFKGFLRGSLARLKFLKNGAL